MEALGADKGEVFQVIPYLMAGNETIIICWNEAIGETVGLDLVPIPYRIVRIGFGFDRNE